MITKNTIQKYVFNSPKSSEVIFVIPIIVSIFGIMIASVEFLSGELLLLGFITSGFLVGISLSVTRNILFPIITVLFYNLTITIQLGMYKPEQIFEVIIRSTGDALFISFTIYWVAVFSQYVLAKVKKLQKPSDEPITIKKFVIGSIFGGILYGLFMVVSGV